MKKLIKWLILILILIAIGVGFYKLGTYIDQKELEKADAKEVLENMEDGTTYYYSEEEIQEFIEKAKELRIKEVEEYDLNPGENMLLRIQYDLCTKEEQELYWGDLTKPKDISKVGYPDSRSYAIYSGGSRPEDVFNKDLSLKNAYVFYGYTSVTTPSLELVRKSKDDDGIFRYMVYALKYWDNKYKDGSINKTVQEILSYEITAGIGNRIFEPSNRKNAEGTAFYFLNKYNNNIKQNSMNSLQRLYSVDYVWNIDNIFDYIVRGYDIHKQKELPYQVFPAEYNYWETDEVNYYTEYYPVSVTKLKDYTYVVNIETVKPVDIYGAHNLATTISSRFAKREDKLVDADNLQIIINVNDSIYHGMERGVLTAEIVQGNRMLSKEGETLYFYTRNDYLWEGYNWYPSSEAQPWVDRYFEIASEAYEADSRFSIFETIELVSEEFDAEYNDVECVIMTIYWMYNNMTPHL